MKLNNVLEGLAKKRVTVKAELFWDTPDRALLRSTHISVTYSFFVADMQRRILSKLDSGDSKYEKLFKLSRAKNPKPTITKNMPEWHVWSVMRMEDDTTADIIEQNKDKLPPNIDQLNAGAMLYEEVYEEVITPEFIERLKKQWSKIYFQRAKQTKRGKARVRSLTPERVESIKSQFSEQFPGANVQIAQPTTGDINITIKIPAKAWAKII